MLLEPAALNIYPMPPRFGFQRTITFCAVLSRSAVSMDIPFYQILLNVRCFLTARITSACQEKRTFLPFSQPHGLPAGRARFICQYIVAKALCDGIARFVCRNRFALILGLIHFQKTIEGSRRVLPLKPKDWTESGQKHTPLRLKVRVRMRHPKPHGLPIDQCHRIDRSTILYCQRSQIIRKACFVFRAHGNCDPLFLRSLQRTCQLL